MASNYVGSYVRRRLLREEPPLVRYLKYRNAFIGFAGQLFDAKYLIESRQCE